MIADPTARRRLNILLIGEEGAGLRVLKALEHGEHRIAMVLTSPPDTPGSAIWSYAEKRGLRLLPARTVKNPAFAEAVRREAIDLLLNVHSLYLLASPLLEAPRIGSFNLHPGPLPRYAGLFAPGWAVYRGERRHGVTVHHMLAGIDTGPIAYQTMFDLTENDTALSVGLTCVEEGVRLVAALVEAASVDPASIPRIEQDTSKREYFGREVPEAGIIRWDRPVAEVDRFIRAFCYHPFPSPWGHPKTTLRGREAAILRASAIRSDTPVEPAPAPPGTVARGPGREVWAACADAWLRLDLVKMGGQRVDPHQVFKPGDQLGR